MYYLVYQKETDGDTFIESFPTVYLLNKKIELIGTNYDYAVFEGKCLKTFNQKHWRI